LAVKFQYFTYCLIKDHQWLPDAQLMKERILFSFLSLYYKRWYAAGNRTATFGIVTQHARTAEICHPLVSSLWLTQMASCSSHIDKKLRTCPVIAARPALLAVNDYFSSSRAPGQFIWASSEIEQHQLL
jgi:hypothetical protein